MADHDPADADATPLQWDRWPLLALERWRLPYGWTVVLVAALGIASLVADTVFRYQKGGVWPARDVAVGIASVVVVVYALIDMRIVKRVSGRALMELRPAVQISDAAYDQFVRRLLYADGRVETLLLVLAAVFVLVFLVLPPDQLRGLPHVGLIESLGILLITLYYTLLFWLLLSLVYVSFRNARTLGALARQPLIVNVFDPVGLLPFGRVSMVQGMAFVGAFLIPFIIVGPPTRQGGGWLVVGLSVIGLLAIFLPLWGVHRQIVKARHDILAGITRELMAVQHALLTGAAQETDALRLLSQRTDLLLQVRKQILSGPTWPFRSSAAVLRVVIAASSPVIYFTLNHLIQTYLFPPIGLK